MIRKFLSRRLTLVLVFGAAALAGNYGRLKGASETPAALPALAAESKAVPATVASRAANSVSQEKPSQSNALTKPAALSSAAVAKKRSAKPVDARGVVGSAAKPQLLLTAAHPRALRSAVPSKLRAMPMPAPQGGSGSPPNAPTLKTPTDTGTGISTSPTLSVGVSDPNSNNVTVNYYGKVIPATTAGSNFTIVALPDTQYYSSISNGGTMAMFNSQTQWIVNNHNSSNIAFVIGLGDIVQNGNNNGNYLEWANADSAVSLLDNPTTTGLADGIPYSFGVGNHDQGPNGNGGLPNDTAGYNQYFGISRYSGKAYYGGHFGTQNDNHYELFSASGMDFIVISLAYDVNANASVLAWANSLLQTYSSRRAIVETHYFINEGFNATWSPQGRATYNALKANPNLFLMLSGHWTPPEGQRADVLNGNRVFTVMSDYQDSGNGGSGWMRILTFVPSTNQVQVQTYSPYLNQSETTASGKFTFNYDMQGSGNGFTLLGSNSGVLSGGTSNFTWSNLTPGSKYEWYVTVSNSTGTAVGPLWTFTTTGTSPVTLSPTSLTFPSQPVGTTSSSQTVTLTNTSSSALNISNIVASSQFGVSDSCPNSPSTLAVNASCSINVTFSPTATGSQSGTITISDNAAGSPQIITLTGTGSSSLSPAVSLSPNSLSFGTPVITMVQDAATTGSGSATLTAKFPGNVTKNNLLVVGASSYAGNGFASPAITDTLGSTWTLAVAKNPGVTGTPAQANIYYAIAPSTGADTITVHMTGTNSLHLHVYEVSGLLTSSVLDQIGSNYQTSATAATVSTAAATTAANEYIFNFVARDNGSGTWTAGSGYSNGLGTPNTGSSTDAFSEGKVVVATGTQTGTATSSAADALTSVIATFKAGGGGIAVGTTSAAQNLTLTNTGSGSLSISGIVASGDFAETDNCGTFVAAAGTCTISVTFTPTATGTRNGTITFTDSASNSPQIYNLTGTGTPAAGPAANLSTTTLSFGNQTVNTSSASQSVTLTNIGSTTMSITSITPSSQYAETDNCGTSVIAGASCTINVSFAPTATGSQPGTLAISDNAPGSPHTVTLSGSGIAALAPAVTLAPTSLTFSSQALNTTSAAQSITLTNSGTASLTISSIVASAQYSDTTTCGASLAAGANCSISVKFTPTATGTQTGTITVTDNASGSPHTVNLTGTGTSSPGVSLSPTSLTFASQTVNSTSAAQSITLTNNGTASLTISSIIASAQYSDTTTCGASLAAGANCSISVTFAPTATGTQTGTITITDSAAGSPHTATLSGTGTNVTAPAVTLAPTSLAFGNQTINTTSAAQTITLTNSGTASLSLTSIAAGAPYSQTNTCTASIAAGGQCTISVKFAPTATGSQPGTLTITDNASGSPQTAALSGTGASAGGTTVSLSPTSLTFSLQQINTTSSSKTVTLTNTGTSTLTLTSIVASGDFTQTNGCGISLVAGAHCSITVKFAPTITGPDSGSLTITDNAAGSPQVVPLTGTGANITISPTTLNFGSQTVGTTSAPQTSTVTNLGVSTVTISKISENSSQYTQTNTCGTSLAGGSSCTISVKFSPTTTGSHNTSVTLTDNVTGDASKITLTGSGQ